MYVLIQLWKLSCKTIKEEAISSIKGLSPSLEIHRYLGYMDRIINSNWQDRACLIKSKHRQDRIDMNILFCIGYAKLNQFDHTCSGPPRHNDDCKSSSRNSQKHNTQYSLLEHGSGEFRIPQVSRLSHNRLKTPFTDVKAHVIALIEDALGAQFGPFFLNSDFVGLQFFQFFSGFFFFFFFFGHTCEAFHAAQGLFLRNHTALVFENCISMPTWTETLCSESLRIRALEWCSRMTQAVSLWLWLHGVRRCPGDTACSWFCEMLRRGRGQHLLPPKQLLLGAMIQTGFPASPS